MLKHICSDRRVQITAILIAGILVLWAFRFHLKELSSVLWPIIVAWAIYGFRTELSALLARIKRFGKEGAEFGEIQIAAQIMAQPVDAALREVAPDENHPRHIAQRVENLRIELNARVPDDLPRREHLLMLRLAQAQQLRDYFMIWLQIFSSQLEALTRMAAEQQPVELTFFHDIHVARASGLSTEDTPVAHLSYELWESFLIQRQLANVTARQAIITPQGTEFLTHAARLNWPRFQIL